MRIGTWLLIVVVVAGLIGVGWYFFVKNGLSLTPSSAEEPYTLPPLTQEYKNEEYGFSVKLPADFTAQIIPADDLGTVTVVLQNAGGEGVQIAITPFDEDLTELTKQRIVQDVPDLRVTDEQVVEIGDNRKGLAFKSDSEAFNGASREVWFVFRGSLYQISTYERLDPLLKAMFATWRFF